jgi:hypothetical protein
VKTALGDDAQLVDDKMKCSWLTKWEARKRTFGTTLSQPAFVLELPRRLQNRMKNKGQSIEISNGQIQSFFNQVLSKISVALEDHLRKLGPNVNREQQKILLVGGFSSSIYVQEFLKSNLHHQFQDQASPGKAIVEGSVAFAKNPSVVAYRCIKNSIGLSVNMVFNAELHHHRAGDAYFDEEGKYCIDNVFSTFFEKGH